MTLPSRKYRLLPASVNRILPGSNTFRRIPADDAFAPVVLLIGQTQLQFPNKDAADALLAGYCALLYERHGTYEEVARRTNLDRRTAKAYVEKHRK